MAGANNGRGGGQKKKLADQFKDACPPHKRKDLDSLIKRLNGEEEKIMQAIQDWWEEPVTPVEAEWEDVSKKSSKKKQATGRGGGTGGGGGGGRGPGRGRQGRSSAGGRGGGREGGRRGGRGGRGRGGEGRGPKPKESPQEGEGATVGSENAVDLEKQATLPPGVPASMAPAALQGAWGQKAAAAAAPLPTMPAQPTETAPVAPPPSSAPEPAQPKPVMETHVAVAPAPAPVAPKPTIRSAGNVWATKGSAHLIKAETAPKSSPATPTIPSPSITHTPAPVRAPPPPKLEEPLEAPPASVLESGLSASVNGANINAAGWKPAAETTQLDSLGTTMSQSIVKETPAPVVPKPEPVPAVTSKPPPTHVLNMGHWETGDNDESLDFGFGSFGAENETPSVGETTMSSSDAAKETSTQTAPPSASPARPPPGLSIGGPTPLPAGAVLVSELESKLEGTSLGQKPPAPAPSDHTSDISQVPAVPLSVPQPPAGQMLPQVAAPGMPQNYNAAAYGMGMYNYNAAPNNGFVAGMHGAPVLAAGAAGGIPPKPQGAPTPAPPHLAQGGLYGTPAASDSNANTTDTPGSAMPPGMPSMAAYNPALFYGQQPYQMGQPHGVGGYGYGYGAQFGGAVQGGFGYQQGMMGQSGGYPSYDDQQQQGNTGGYQKNNTGGYRGRGSANQYQTQYNPQGAYGGQPYGMGYNVDHFSQRGGYGHGGMDPYGGMQQQQGGSNFQNHAFQSDEDDHHKGKKGGRNNGFQQHPQQQLGGQQQQSFGLQGDSNSNSNAGWSNQAGSWGGPSWQQGS